MDCAPYQWRFDGGYFPPEGSVPYGFYPPFPSYDQQPITYVQGPIPVQAVFSSPTPTHYIAAAPTTPFLQPANKKSSNKSSSKAFYEPPPALRPGMNYLFPSSHTMLHIFNKASRIWEPKYRGQQLNFKIFKVSTRLRVQDIIKRILHCGADADNAAKGWAATEVIEQGCGAWAKGNTLEYGHVRAQRTLEEMGWTEARGVSLPPVWLVIHKV